MKNCKHCNSTKLTLSGIVKSKQRYRCKDCGKTSRDCGKTSREGDKRIVHSLEKKIKVIKSYLEGVGIRSIARLENISAPMIINLIRAFSKKLQEKLQNQKVNEDIRNIEILEIDELFTYVQKKLPESKYGLLLIETEMKLLILK